MRRPGVSQSLTTSAVQEVGVSAVTLLTGLGIDEYLTRTDATGTRTLLTDALGSTVALTDPAEAVQSEYTYEPFGAVTETGTDTNSFQYTGRENDRTGLYYYRARYYHPERQRFISEDPLDISEVMLLRQADPTDMDLGRLYSTLLSRPELLHPSVYVANSPLNYSDPSGEIIPQVVGCAVGA